MHGWERMLLIRNISYRIVETIKKYRIITEEDQDIYQYGMELLTSTFINLLLIITIGVIFDKLPQTILFLLEYCFVKRYAGGYHASTHARCILTFSVLYTVMLLGFRVFQVYRVTLNIFVIGIISIISVLILAPVEDKNKPLEQEEIELYSFRSKRILLFEVVFNILLYIWIGDKSSLLLFAMAAQIWVGFAVVAGAIKNKRNSLI